MTKKCDRCYEPYKGFGTTCSSCRKNSSAASPAGTKSLSGSPGIERCDLCAKTVYAMEKLAVEGRVFHKDCFRCAACGRKLAGNDFDKNELGFFCPAHSQQLNSVTGGYRAGTGPTRNANAATLVLSMLERAEHSFPSAYPSEVSAVEALEAGARAVSTGASVTVPSEMVGDEDPDAFASAVFAVIPSDDGAVVPVGGEGLEEVPPAVISEMSVPGDDGGTGAGRTDNEDCNLESSGTGGVDDPPGEEIPAKEILAKEILAKEIISNSPTKKSGPLSISPKRPPPERPVATPQAASLNN